MLDQAYEGDARIRSTLGYNRLPVLVLRTDHPEPLARAVFPVGELAICVGRSGCGSISIQSKAESTKGSPGKETVSIGSFVCFRGTGHQVSRSSKRREAGPVHRGIFVPSILWDFPE